MFVNIRLFVRCCPFLFIFFVFFYWCNMYFWKHVIVWKLETDQTYYVNTYTNLWMSFMIFILEIIIQTCILCPRKKRIYNCYDFKSVRTSVVKTGDAKMKVVFWKVRDLIYLFTILRSYKKAQNVRVIIFWHCFSFWHHCKMRCYNFIEM